MRTEMPTAKDFLEFAERSKVVNLETPLRSILENYSVLEERLSIRDPGAVAGWFVYSPGYAIIVGAEFAAAQRLEAVERTPGIG